MMSPTSLKELTDHNYLDYHTFEYLERRAKGGAACINLGDGFVHETGLVKWSKKLKLYDSRSEPGIYTLCKTKSKIPRLWMHILAIMQPN